MCLAMLAAVALTLLGTQLLSPPLAQWAGLQLPALPAPSGQQVTALLLCVCVCGLHPCHFSPTGGLVPLPPLRVGMESTAVQL